MASLKHRDLGGISVAGTDPAYFDRGAPIEFVLPGREGSLIYGTVRVYNVLGEFQTGGSLGQEPCDTILRREKLARG